MEGNFRTISFDGEELELLDQRKLPNEEVYVRCKDEFDVANAIQSMIVRGAPAIGVTAAYGMALSAKRNVGMSVDRQLVSLREAAVILGETRPTAINLYWAIRRTLDLIKSENSTEIIMRKLLDFAASLHLEDIEICKKIGDLGSTLLPDDAHVLTHCNAGALATAGYGTAGGVIRSGFRDKRVKDVYVDETRPFLQGARLTAWELNRDGIPVILISDNMAGYCMKLGKINVIVVGADRIAANGDVANKIGTYSLAILAKKHNIPFFVAAPTSTIDMDTESGEQIPIEERAAEEIKTFAGKKITPDEVKVFNPAFDVTPSELVDALITEKGVVFLSSGEKIDSL
ncbi:MAG: S-methyl-5-thioribose-1-phosphate isomerase [Nitrospinota bacterium]|nr:S-methyl-5-thioribose-1-phosphate isomerase [Nitrospinota bacterium]